MVQVPEAERVRGAARAAASEPTLAVRALLEVPGRDEAQARGRAPRGGWRAILAAASPREVLARLMSGDPLELRALCARRIEEHRYLVDVDRVFLRAVARTARFAHRYRGLPELDTWLGEQVDTALL